ncbi:hypothetical protein ABT218_36565 [Streptomyces sp. NPDC001455]|uniref:hypothetical protein n=1 Tax=unclassified Streptomyces TaxID=2593676 RepID=UPI00331A1DFB
MDHIEVDAAGVPSPLSARHVPYIALTAGETSVRRDLVSGADGWITYRNPGPFDRYPQIDVLLARYEGTPRGPVDGNRLSPYRQFHCMERLVCQGCGRRSAARSHGNGVLWVLPKALETGEPAPLAGPSDMPPSCARCAVHWCPVLAERGRLLCWVGEAEVTGVYADVYPPPKGIMVPERYVPLEDEQTLSAAVATRLVRDLRQVTLADESDVAELLAHQRRSC